jgi:hypothetical protein
MHSNSIFKSKDAVKNIHFQPDDAILSQVHSKNGLFNLVINENKIEII